MVRVLALLLTVAAVLVSCANVEQMSSMPAFVEPDPIEPGRAPPPGPYASGFDALHYDISLVLPDTGSFITGQTTGRFRLEGARRDTLPLDLSGMAVTDVRVDGRAAGFRLDAGKLLVAVPRSARVGETIDVLVSYRGRPDDGLILGRNLHGTPSAFADNWPNRARYWFPSIDHPSDKASVSFSVRTRPATGRRVIANGVPEEPSEAGVWRWRNRQPIPTYTMVVGASEFSVNEVGEVCRANRCIEVTTWLFPNDSARGAESFRRADDMVAFYDSLIAPFPYDKLAHVQSATRFGGMENVTAIFYAEEPISEGIDIESTVAHETAHQWFGDAVTEADWHHLWLSEGFAEYFGALYFEHADGIDRFREMMEESRQGYLLSDAVAHSIVDVEQENLFNLLNANNYNKGGWVLHMLRRRLGDAVFFEGIRNYYRTFEHATVLTSDFRGVMETASGSDLETFFEQWIFQPGYPQLSATWSWSDGVAQVRIEQVQAEEWPAFEVPITLLFETADGPVIREIEVDERIEELRVEVEESPTTLLLDPNVDLLAQIVSVAKTAVTE